MNKMAGELSWEYGECLEGTPIFARLNSQESRYDSTAVADVILNRHQVEQVLRSLNDSAFILQHVLNQTDSPPDKEYSKTWRIIRRRIWPVCDACANRVLISTIIFQVLNITCNSLLDLAPRHSNVVHFTIMTVALTLSGINLLIVLAASVAILRAMSVYSTTVIRVVITYICSILAFSGMYCATLVAQTSAWTTADEAAIDDQFVTSYARFVYFSVSVATTCGVSSVTPTSWYSGLLVGIQMVLSILLLLIFIVTWSWNSVRPSGSRRDLGNTSADVTRRTNASLYRPTDTPETRSGYSPETPDNPDNSTPDTAGVFATPQPQAQR